MCRIILIIIICFLTLDSTAAPLPKQFTLKEAILIALRYNPNVRNAELERIIDKFGLEVAKNAYELRYALIGTAQSSETRTSGQDSSARSLNIAPSTSLLAPSGANISLDMQNNTGNTYFNPGLNLAIKQPLLRGFGSEITLSPLASAYDQERIKQLNLKKTIIETITTIITDYLRIVQDQNSLTIQQLTLKDLEKQYQQNEIKIKAGKMAAADNIQQQASIANQRLSLVQAQNTIKQDKLQLLTDMGLDPNTPFTITNDVALPDENLPTLLNAKQLILSNDTSYQTSLINRIIQARDLMMAKDNQRWKLDLTAKASVGNGSGGSPNSGIASLQNNQNYNRSVQLDLTIPIDDKKLQQSLVNAKVSLQKLDVQIQQQQYMLETAIINALRNLAIQKQQIQQSIIARDLAQRSLDVALKKLQFGLVSTFETTTLRTSLTNAELQVVNSKINYLNALANLQQALGTTLGVWGIDVKY